MENGPPLEACFFLLKEGIGMSGEEEKGRIHESRENRGYLVSERLRRD